MAKSSITFVFTLTLALVYTFLFLQARVTFSGLDEAEYRVQALKNHVERQKIRTAMVQMQFDEFRNFVSVTLPEDIPANTEEHYPLRQLASVLKTSDSYKLKLVKASDLMAIGKQHFAAEEYAEANQNFKKIIDFYSFSHHVIEAHYLYAEGLFLMSDYENCVSIIKTMIELFPESELTGYSMLRLGKIFESQRRSTEAMDIYKAVLSTFPNRGLATAANESIEGLEL